MTTFALDYTGPERALVLRQRARALTTADIPADCLRAPVAYVGPVAGECDAALVRALDARFVEQGCRAGCGVPTPAVGSRPRISLTRRAWTWPLCRRRITRASTRSRAQFTATGTTVAITHGARGATLATAIGLDFAIPAAAAREVDPTGAGDVFGVVLTLQLAAGTRPGPAARAAAEAAARVVEGPLLGSL